jgi:hypothetical protein
MSAELDARLKAIEAEMLVHDWQRHRMVCLEMAIKIGVQTAEQTIDLAEKLSAYILSGKPRS